MPTSFESIIARYSGNGPYLTVQGTTFIDAASGTFNLPLGYTNTRIATKLKEQIDRCVHLASSFTHELSECILKKLLKHTPDKINRIWLRDVSGSGAVECAIRMAQKASGRSGVISLYLAHHGQSLATAHISGNAFRMENFHATIDGSFKIPAPHSVLAQTGEPQVASRYADLEHALEFGSNGKVACLIIEPILGNGDNIVVPTDFFQYVNDVCRKNKIIIIADEVQTGFGRTGDFFASNGYAKALDPDIIVFAKSAGAIGIPTAGVLMSQELDVLDPFEHSSTSGANPLSLVALNEIIGVIEDEDLLGNVRRNEPHLRRGLLALQEKYPVITGVRGIGYMYGFDTPSPQFAAQAVECCASHGLIIRGSRYGKGRTLKVRPPLVCERQHLDEIIEKLDATFEVMTADRTPCTGRAS